MIWVWTETLGQDTDNDSDRDRDMHSDMCRNEDMVDIRGRDMGTDKSMDMKRTDHNSTGQT